ncbi:MFS transporter [Dactylosporangium sp. NPDC000244]|uniref:MFS transporter n=1 Tax=Dactylosporangium sp. NPDC000244 TaxID=3154365 RepID=UPI00333495A8
MVTAPARAATAAALPGRRRATVLIACVANFVVLADATIVNVALPAMRHDLRIAPAQLPWVVDSYTLVFGACLLLGGLAADRAGPRLPFVAGMAVFTAGCVLCGLAGDAGALFAGRAVQGAGGALFSPAALALAMAAAGTAAERVRVLALWGALGAAAVAAGPVLGGLVTASLGWAALFWLPGLLCGAAALAALRLPAGGGDAHPGPAGGDRAPDRAAFPARRVAAACAATALSCGALVGVSYAATLWLQEVLGFGVVTAGLLLLPLSLGIVAGSAAAPALLRRCAPWRLAVAGSVVTAAGIAALIPMTARSPVAWPVAALALLAFGFGAQSVPVTLAATAVPRRAGLATAGYQTAGQLGGGVGLAALAALAVAAGGAAPAGAGTIPGYRALFAGAALAAVAAALLGAGMRESAAPRSEVPAAPEDLGPVDGDAGRGGAGLAGQPQPDLRADPLAGGQYDRRVGRALDPGRR